MSHVKRLEPQQVVGMCDSEEEVARYIEQDYLIRIGCCPNGCGLMMEDERRWQTCPTCGFWTNTKAEPTHD